MSVLPNVEKTGIADKMSLLFKSNDSSWIDVDFSDWNVEHKNFFDKIRDSIIERFVLKLKYINSNGEISERIAEPLKLYFKSKSWYLIAYCRKADDYRMFRLSRIREVEVTNEHFEREMCEYKYDNDDENICVNVKLKISKNAEYRVYDEFQNAEKTADGDFIVNMSYPENEWLYGYIMSFGAVSYTHLPQIVAANKTDIIQDMDAYNAFLEEMKNRGIEVFEISAATNKGVAELMNKTCLLYTSRCV